MFTARQSNKDQAQNGAPGMIRSPAIDGQNDVLNAVTLRGRIVKDTVQNAPQVMGP